METVLSGIRPTGQLHLGNYFGALRNFTKMQHTDRCFFFIADYHALTTHPDPSSLHGNVRNILAEYLAAGLDPEVATIYVQSDVPEVAELSLLLSMHAYVGELERTASFKDKVRKNPNNVNAGLSCYPVLMASDILLHRATRVPVGKDQEQHLELTRLYARRFNSIYGVEFFPESQPYNFGEELIKIPGLDGSGKMGKSEGNCIYLSDPQEGDEGRYGFGSDRAQLAHFGARSQHFCDYECSFRSRYHSILQRTVCRLLDSLWRLEEAAGRGYHPHRRSYPRAYQGDLCR